MPTSEANELTARVKKQVDAVKKPFLQFSKNFAALAESREELAPKFMKAFGSWQAVTGGTFVDFVRYLVPEVGATRQEYRSHRAYQAAEYLRRLVATQQQRQRNVGQDTEARGAAAVTPIDAVARLIKAMMPLVMEDQHQRFWEAMYTQLHWTDRQVHRVQNLVAEVNPLVVARAPRGQELPHLRIMLPVVQEQAEQEESGAQRARPAA